MHSSYDVIIIGAGSIGIPTALALSKNKIKILVIDAKSSPGQGDNKKAIGGIRATHSEFSKIIIGKRSLEIFSTWEKIYGNNIEWSKGGYLFPVYRQKEKKILTSLIPNQQKYGLKINFVDKKITKTLIPGINEEELMGAIFSPEDGMASPLLSINAFTEKAIENGVVFKFKEKVDEFIINNKKINGVKTNKNQYSSPIIIDAAGKHSPYLSSIIKAKIDVIPELHEAGITEPTNLIFKSMIVDLRSDNESKNFYFYQNTHGQIIFCITPSPSISGINTYETSVFLPQAGKRILTLMPNLSSIRVRRTWRGCYPMTPDGSPLIGWNDKIKGLLHATGMCGQGFMLGPGIGELINRIINKKQTEIDKKIQRAFSPKRKFFKQEALT